MDKISINARVANKCRDHTDLLMSAVIYSTSWPGLPCRKSVVAERCTVAETTGGMDLDLSASLRRSIRIEDRSKALSVLSVVDRLRTWSRLFNLNVAEVRS